VPTYVYRCQQCGSTIERRQGFHDAPLTECETCGGDLRKVIMPPQVIFKGPGFYSTDYRSKNGASDSSSGSSSEESSESKSSDSNSSDSKSSDSKSSESKPADAKPAASTATES